MTPLVEAYSPRQSPTQSLIQLINPELASLPPSSRCDDGATAAQAMMQAARKGYDGLIEIYLAQADINK